MDSPALAAVGISANSEVESSHARLAALRADTDRALEGAALSDPVFVAFQRVITRHAIPHRYPLDLLEGFAMDVERRRYATLDDTLLYCYHVAGVVGVMMAMVMGARDRETLDRACDLGIAFQITNIARDVLDDASVGRSYLPSAWLIEAGLPPDAVADIKYRQPLAAVTQRLLAEAERYYASARIGLAHLPLRSAWAIAAALRIYRAIGIGVTKRGEHAWDQRVRVSRMRKLGFAALAGLDAVRARPVWSSPAHSPRAGLWTRA